MKLREKTTATLLIAIFMISIFAVVMPVSAQGIYYVTKAGDDSTGDGSEGSPWLTIQHAVDTVDHDDTILVGSGDYYGAVVNKDIEIRGEEGARIVYDPLHVGWQFGFKLIVGSDGATISHFTFQGVELAIYGWGPDDVTVEHNKIYDTYQGITNWDGDNWVIRHNRIEGIAVVPEVHNGGGIGICFGSRGDTVSGNTIAHNRIVAHFPDDFTFSVGGILLCTDEREVPTRTVSNNKIVHNKVKITGIDSWAISLELIPPKDVDPVGILRDNVVGFNDLRGSDNCIDYYPDAAMLEDINTISRNLCDDERWSLVGEWELRFTIDEVDYDHSMSITEETDTTFSGIGQSPAEISWVVEGTKDDNELTMLIDYEEPSPHILEVEGTIADDGSMSGTWVNLYNNNGGTWVSIDGSAILHICTRGANRGQGEVPASVFNPAN